MTPEKMAEVLSLIHPTASDEDLDGCDLIIEAVFENMNLKHQMTRDLEPRMAEGGIWGSNTSTLPITQLAEASQNAENFIGIHFFLQSTRCRSLKLSWARRRVMSHSPRRLTTRSKLRKPPLLLTIHWVSFSRTFGTYLDEGVRMLVEGVKPVRIDNLGKAVGMPVGPLTVYDEVSLELSRKAQETWKEMGLAIDGDDRSITAEVVETMIGEHGRGGRYHGGGFYEYGADGSKEVWSGLSDLYGRDGVDISDRTSRSACSSVRLSRR